MIENLFLVTVLPIDEDSSEEIFGIFSDIKQVKIAINQFSKEIEVELVENTHYEISELTLNKSNYFLTK